MIGLALVAWDRRLPSRRSRLFAAVIAGPYALWAFLAQNVIEQPRHLLPLVVGLVLVIAHAFRARPLLGLAAVAVVLAGSTPLMIERLRTPPAAAQAAAHVAATYAPAQVAVFGGRAIRFFNVLAPAIPTRQRTWLSEVDVEAERLDVLPPTLLVTSEVEPDPIRDRQLSRPRTFCRDARLDRAQNCLTIREYRIR